MKKALEEVETLGNLGKVEEASRLLKSVDDLRARKIELEVFCLSVLTFIELSKTDFFPMKLGIVASVIIQ